MCEERIFFFLTSCQINFSQRVKFVKRLFKHCAHVFIRYYLHDIKSLQIQILMLSKKKIKSASLERLSLMMFARGIGIIMRICTPTLYSVYLTTFAATPNEIKNKTIPRIGELSWNPAYYTKKNAEILMNYRNLLWPSGLFIWLDSIHFYQFWILVN